MFADASPLAIPILSLIVPMVAVVAHYLYKAYAQRQRHMTLREFVREYGRTGQPIPPELLAELQEGNAPGARAAPDPNRILLPGVINIGLGIGLMGMFFAMNPNLWLWAIGLIPLFLGMGLIVLWAFLRKQTDRP
jgi:hypothetical protein